MPIRLPTQDEVEVKETEIPAGTGKQGGQSEKISTISVSCIQQKKW